MAFEGKPDPAYVGKYRTSDGRSNYTFGEDGGFELKGKVATPGGMIDQNVKGQWAVNGDRFLFKYGEGNVVPYAYKKEGDKLKLTLTGTMKRETVLVKQ